jgi:phage FluMu gp28-like protein
MTAILPSMKIDSDAQASRYFLPYQLTWIADDSRMRLAEKSVRIGWTFCDAFKNVRKRLHHKNRDYLFATKDQASAFEYVDTCKKFCEIFDLTKTILSHGVDSINAPIIRDGKDTGFTEEIKVGYIKFDTGSRIIAFSSNPQAMQVYGGDVGLDEFAKARAILFPSSFGKRRKAESPGAMISASGRATTGPTRCSTPSPAKPPRAKAGGRITG